MLRSTRLFALVALVATQVSAIEYDGGSLAVVSQVPVAVGSGKVPAFASPAISNLEYSNIANYQGVTFVNGGAALQGTNTITRLVADDITPTGANAGIDVLEFAFTIANLNPGAVTFRPRIRFWFADGASNGPGTYYNQPVAVGFTFSPLVVNGNSLVLVRAPLFSGLMTMPGSTFWAGITFDDSDGTTGATAAQLDNLGQGIFGPPTAGSSTATYFQSVAAGSFFNIANPAGTLVSFPIPAASFGWEFSVDATVAVREDSWTAIKGLYRDGTR
jgi:hypothetical protein